VTADNRTKPIDRNLDRRLEGSQEIAVGATEHAGRPRVQILSPLRHVERLNHQTVRIAAHEPSWTAIAGQHLDCFHRHGTCSHIATKHDQVHAGFLDFGKDSLQGGQVSMDVA